MILLTSTFAFWRQILALLHPVSDLTAMLQKMVGVGVLWFFAYQLAFFMRPIVRQKFGGSGLFPF